MSKNEYFFGAPICEQNKLEATVIPTRQIPAEKKQVPAPSAHELQTDMYRAIARMGKLTRICTHKYLMVGISS